MKTAIFPHPIAPHRGGTERIGVFRKFNSAERLPLIGALERVREFNLENHTSITITKPVLADLALNDPNIGFSFAPAPFLTNSIIAYEALGQKLGNEVVYKNDGLPRVILPTGRYRGASDIALVALSLTPTDFRRVEDPKTGVNDIWLDICEERLIAIENFPSENGWYMPEAKTSVPAGKIVPESESARELWRIQGPMIGTILRDIHEKAVLVIHDLFYAGGVVVDIPKHDFEVVGHLSDYYF